MRHISLGLKLVDKTYYYYGAIFIQLAMGILGKPPPQLRYVAILCFMYISKTQMLSSEFLSLPHLPNVDI